MQLAKFLTLLVLSLVLIIYDRDLGAFKKLRASFMPLVVVPFYQVVNWPSNVTKNILNNFILKRQLISENNYLRLQLLLIQASLQKLQALEQENTQLYTLLKSATELQRDFLAAKLIKFNLLDKGAKDKVQVGQPVMDAYGLIGQVIATAPNVSKVLLISDIKSAIPAMVVRNGARVFVAGQGDNNNLGLVNIPETMDLKPGDLLVTASAGEYFPLGLAIGVIATIERIPGNRFVRVSVKMSAHINDSKNVLVVK